MNKKFKLLNAFTLAEVLITLAIIGVVAAVTMPMLTVRAKEKQRVGQLKKTYSVLNQAYLRATQKYGPAQDWNLAKTNTGETDEEGNPIYDYSGSVKALNYLAEFMNAKHGDESLVFAYYNLHGVLRNDQYEFPSDRYVYLNDNTILYTGWVGSKNEGVYFDLVVLFSDCLKNGRCTLGKDLFYFVMTSDNGILPTGLQYSNSKFYTNVLFESRCNKKVDHDLNGYSCTAWVIYNGNMDYLHCDDLSWSGKHKCK